MAEFAGRWNLVAQDRDWSPKKPDGDSEDGLASSPTF
jgi:hypothetical protein